MAFHADNRIRNLMRRIVVFCSMCAAGSLLSACYTETVDNAKIGMMKFDKSMQQWMASIQSGERGLEWGEMPEEEAPVLPPPSYCYSTLGVVDCYDTPQENAKGRLVGNIAPAAAPVSKKSKYDATPEEILARGIKPGEPQPKAIEASESAKEAVVDEMPDMFPGRGRPGYLLRNPKTESASVSAPPPPKPATPGMMIFSPERAAAAEEAEGAGADKLVKEDDDAPETVPSAPKPLVNIPGREDPAGDGEWVATSAGGASEGNITRTPPAVSEPGNVPPAPPAITSSNAGKLLKSTSHEITYDSSGNKVSN